MCAKRTVGYPTRADAVEALLQQGLSTSEIAERIGIRPAAVSTLVDRGHIVAFALRVFKELRPHALRRQITVNTLVHRLIGADTLDQYLNDSYGSDA